MFADVIPLHEVAVIFPDLGIEVESWTDYAMRRMAERFSNARSELGTIHMVNRYGVENAVEAIRVVSLTIELRELDLTVLYGIGMKIAAALEESGVAVSIDGDYLVF